MLDLEKRFDENEEQYIWRVGQLKDNGLLDLDWEELATVINKNCRDDESTYRNESAYRKPYQQAKRFYDAGVFTLDSDLRIKELTDAKHEVRKEKQKLFDERVALNRELREQGRRENIYDIMLRALNNSNRICFEDIETNIEHGEDDFIIHLTDLHCGMNIDSPLNVFNTDVLKARLEKYISEISELVSLYHPENAYVIFGGDMIHGLIHLNARLESKETVNEQIVVVSDLLSCFVDKLRTMFKMVNIYTTAGNHARVLQKKEDNYHGENLDLLVTKIVERDFRNVSNVKFHDNYLDFDVASFEVRGHMVYATHGDKDSVNTIVYNMTKFARKANMRLPDMCFLGHRHTNGLKTVDDVKVIESGCIDGMDTYCLDNRLVGTPEQVVVVVSKEKMIKAFCDIQLD